MVFSIDYIHMTISVALRKARKEKLWSLAMVGLLTIGLTTSMVVPSLSSSLQEGLSSYANNVATYVFVYNTGSESYDYRIPANVTNEIVELEGVQQVYPIVSNYTHFPFGFEGNISGGAIMGRNSAVIGGQTGFPSFLISISAGRLPENEEAGFVINGIASWSFTLNQTYTVLFELSSENESLNGNIFRDFLGREYLQFNATVVGQMPYNPMLQQVDILWNPAFLRQKLGDQLYEETFGGEGGTLFIVKAHGIEQVENVADKLQSMFSRYLGYSVVYDRETVKAQLSFQTGSKILYDLIGIVSLFSVIAIVFVFSYVFSGRRRWEAGLLITQGWSWRRVTKLFFYYYLILGLIAAVFSIGLSILISSQITYSFQVYANTLVIPVVITPATIITGIAISLVVSILAAYFAVWRMRKMGLDNLLREY